MKRKGEIKFWNGSIAIAEGALAAGCRFFAGYPITPASDIAEYMALRLPQEGGVFIQMEDEIASIMAIIGAAWGGAKAMTATSGPGFSLMQENIGYAASTETPVVIVDAQRAGPSTGMPTLAGQGDVMQTRWGSHGDYETIVISPSSPQEGFDLIIRAFNLAELYRVPVILLTDECVVHMYERVVIPPLDEIEIVERIKPDVPPEQYIPFKPINDIAPMAAAGEGYRVHVTGLTHDERGYPMTTSPEVQEWMVRHICDKIRRNEPKLRDIEEYRMDDADIVVVSYGIVGRSAKAGVKIARKHGIKAGLIRLKTIWPFPEKYFDGVADNVKKFIVAEINYGQLKLEVERSIHGKAGVELLPKFGGEVHKPEEIYKKIKEVKNGN